MFRFGKTCCGKSWSCILHCYVTANCWRLFPCLGRMTALCVHRPMIWALLIICSYSYYMLTFVTAYCVICEYFLVYLFICLYVVLDMYCFLIHLYHVYFIILFALLDMEEIKVYCQKIVSTTFSKSPYVSYGHSLIAMNTVHNSANWRCTNIACSCIISYL